MCREIKNGLKSLPLITTELKKSCRLETGPFQWLRAAHYSWVCGAARLNTPAVLLDVCNYSAYDYACLSVASDNKCPRYWFVCLLCCTFSYYFRVCSFYLLKKVCCKNSLLCYAGSRLTHLLLFTASLDCIIFSCAGLTLGCFSYCYMLYRLVA